MQPASFYKETGVYPQPAGRLLEDRGVMSHLPQTNDVSGMQELKVTALVEQSIKTSTSLAALRQACPLLQASASTQFLKAEQGRDKI